MLLAHYLKYSLRVCAHVSSFFLMTFLPHDLSLVTNHWLVGRGLCSAGRLWVPGWEGARGLVGRCLALGGEVLGAWWEVLGAWWGAIFMFMSRLALLVPSLGVSHSLARLFLLNV